MISLPDVNQLKMLFLQEKSKHILLEFLELVVGKKMLVRSEFCLKPVPFIKQRQVLLKPTACIQRIDVEMVMIFKTFDSDQSFGCTPSRDSHYH